MLVVDDNAFFRRFLRDLLQGQGFTVHEAADGEDGLRVALEKRPWLILTDVRMPGTDGFEFCRNVRTHSLIRQTPLLFLSGWDEHKQRYHGLKLGADDFLSKETSVRELLIRIQLVMKRYAGPRRAQGRGDAGRDRGAGRARRPAGLPPHAGSRARSSPRTARGWPPSASATARSWARSATTCRGSTASSRSSPGRRGPSGSRRAIREPARSSAASSTALLLDGCRRLDEANREQEPESAPS